MALNRPADRSTDRVTLPAEELGPIEFSEELSAELLDSESWRQVLKTYAASTGLAVALTDRQGHLLGECHNPQPWWRMAKGATGEFEGACPFCLWPCSAVVDAVRTGETVMARDEAGPVHAAVPLSLGGRPWGALIAGQELSLAAWQVPVEETTLQVFASLLLSLGNAFLGQRYAAILQRKIAATDLRYRMLIDAVHDYAWYTVDRAGCVAGWNSGAERMFGHTETEILGQDSACLFIPEDTRKEAILQSLKDADRQGWIESEGWRIHKDGRRFFATGVLAPLGHGKTREYGLLIHDVTELRSANEAVRQAQKLESIGVLAGCIAHDFNNLLTGIMVSVTVAKTSLPPDHAAYPVLEVAEHSCESAAELTTQLLAYAGKGKFVITRFDLSKLVTEMLPLIEASVPKAVQLLLFPTPELPWIEGDASQIRQIVMNLIINGAEAIGEGGGTVRVSTGVRDRLVYLEVKDSGSGMSEATKVRIFDPFFTTKFTGRGLGLAAVAGIIRAHNGRMDLESISGEGTTFTVFFPAVEPVVQAVKTRTSSIAQSAGAILFVDDQPALVKMSKLALERAGYSVRVAKDGQEAVDMFRQSANSIAAVLLDVTMPVMSGTEAFRLIREMDPDVPIILMTGFNESIAREDLGAGTAAGFIQKPYSFGTLLETVRASLENRGFSQVE